jgi:hypothetical protein
MRLQLELFGKEVSEHLFTPTDCAVVPDILGVGGGISAEGKLIPGKGGGSMYGSGKGRRSKPALRSGRVDQVPRALPSPPRSTRAAVWLGLFDVQQVNIGGSACHSQRMPHRQRTPIK